MKLSTEQTGCIEAEILKRVRAHPGISRVALARDLQIAPSTIGNYVGRLILEGFLEESASAVTESGRPPTSLRLNPDCGQFIGVDFEARNIMATAVDFSDRPLKHAHKTIQNSDTVAGILSKIEEAITEVMPGGQTRVLAIGLGVPGLVDPARGLGLEYKYIEGWRDVQLVSPLASRFGVPVYIENTIRSMALAELWFGQGRGIRDWLCLGIRSGIAAGIILGGQLERGSNHRAGEIGRWRCVALPASLRRLFSDGNSQATAQLELQEVASVRAILAALQRARRAGRKSILFADDRPLTFSEVAAAARQRDKVTMEILEVAAENLGGAVAHLSLALNPSRIILAGPLTLLGNLLLDPLRQTAEKLLIHSGGEVPMIVNSTMGEYSGALGAAALAVHEWKPAR
ncbi:MAG TPA: ROK family transcriptional regulator [Verrucomicrobiae bacterium]|nr:ROK family transcriptional regulator [Verrucomicrobiae bacterium]